MVRRPILAARKRVLGTLAFLLTLGGTGFRLPVGWGPFNPRVCSAAEPGLEAVPDSAEHTAEPAVGPDSAEHSGACFRGTPECRRFWITDFRYGFRIDSTPDYAGDKRVTLALGQMWRTGRRDAFGGALTMIREGTTRYGVEGRYRRWLSEDLHLDAATGLWTGGTAYDEDGEFPLVGMLLRAEAGFGDSIGLWTQADRARTGTDRVATQWTAGVTFGSYAGLSAFAIGAALVVVYAISLGITGGT